MTYLRSRRSSGMPRAQRIELDYIARNSLRVDLGLLIATVPTLLAGGGVEGHPSDDPLARPDQADPDGS